MHAYVCRGGRAPGFFVRLRLLELPLSILFLAAVSAALVLVMIRVGALDHPVARSSHMVPTPKGGGVGIAAAFALGVTWQVHVTALPPSALVLVAAALFLAGISYSDDVKPASAALKFSAQFVAAASVVAIGDRLNVTMLAGHALHVPFLASMPLTMAWLLFVTNSINFIDGLNGLAAGSAAIAAAALVSESTSISGIAQPLVAGIAGFLPFNYPRARIFMGDVGSQLCGFVIADLAVRAAAGLASLVVPLAILPILVDVAFTLMRRAYKGARLTQAHRGHLYQVANRTGMNAAWIAAIYWGMATWGAACGAVAGSASIFTCVGAVVAAVIPIAVWLTIVILKAKRAGITAW